MKETRNELIDTITLSDALYYTCSFMVSKEENILSYEKEILKILKSIEISDITPGKKSNKNITGKVLYKKKDNRISIWINSNIYDQDFIITVIHEMNHVTSFINSKKIKKFKLFSPTNYNGFMHDNKNNKEYGKGLNEFVNEFLTQMQYFHYYKDYQAKFKTADIVFDNNQTFWYDNSNEKSVYLKAMSIPRLLGVACENKPNVSYEDLLNNGISPVTGLVKGRNGETKYINDMIYASKFTSLDLKSNINKLTKNPKSYDILIKNSDYILEKIKNNNFNNNDLSNECRNVLIETFDIIKNYHEKKAEYNYLTGFWNEDDFQKSHERFNYVYNDVLKEFNLTNNKEPKRMVK